MKILVSLFSNEIIYIGNKIERDVFPKVDPERELYKVINEQGVFYAITNDFIVYDIPDNQIPENYYNYTYTPEDGFVYHEPVKSQEEIIMEQILVLQELEVERQYNEVMSDWLG